MYANTLHYSYGMSSQSMLLNNVNCSHNNFIHILQCSYSTIINSDCNNTNSYDATVYCCEFFYHNTVWYHYYYVIAHYFWQMKQESGTAILFLVWYAFKEANMLIKVVWKFTVMDNGEQFVTMVSVLMMPGLYVNN